VYQHVLGHAGATMIGDRRMLKSFNNQFTGFQTARTGTELTELALQQDIDELNLGVHTRAESEAEIRGDFAGRDVGNLMVSSLSGNLEGSLRQELFDVLCDH
jgi:hypothetical protein